MNRIKQIDILRAIAILLVLIRHMQPCPIEINSTLHKITSFWRLGGWVGVDLFFVLSGFLVSGLLFREYKQYQQIDVSRFLIRRGFKIYPLFWTLILVTSLIELFNHRIPPWKAVVSELFFIQNYASSMWPPTWSLAVEEHFYFFIAIGAYFLTRAKTSNPFSKVPLIFLLIGLFCLSARIYAVNQGPHTLKHCFFPSHLRFDSLFFGVFLAYLSHYKEPLFSRFINQFRNLLLFLGTVILSFAFYQPIENAFFIWKYGLTAFYIGSGCLLLSFIASPTPHSKVLLSMTKIGKYSYSIYVWHMPFSLWFAVPLSKFFPQNLEWIAYSFIYLSGSIAFGTILSILIETPTLRIRDRLFPSRSP